MSTRLPRTPSGAAMSSHTVINLALDALVAVRGSSEHDALHELLAALHDSRLGPAGIGAVLTELVNDTSPVR